MDWLRTLLIGAIAAVTLALIVQWSDFKDARQKANILPTTTSTSVVETNTSTPENLDFQEPASVTNTSADIPSLTPEKAQPDAPVPTSASAQLISVTTDNFEVLIDTLGGDIVKVALRDYKAELNKPDPFILLNRNDYMTYVAQSGLIGPNGTDTAEGRPVYHTASNAYTMQEGSDTLTVDLNLNQNGVLITKRYIFTRHDHLIKLDYIINNQSDSVWAANLFGQIKRDSKPVQTTEGALAMKPYLGAAITTPDEHFKKVKFSSLDDEAFQTTITGGWTAMVQHYFLSAWVPDQSVENHFNLRKQKNRDMYLLGFTSPRTEIAAGATKTISASFYAGPKDVYRLEKISPYLDLTVDYGWLWWIAKPIFYFLHWIYNIIGNWGFSIIVLTVVIKAAFFKLSATSYRSMAKMRKLQPMMAQLKERYGDDKQKMSQELMKLYKKEGANPLSGCLPILIQMPVFISLYWVLMESVELRHTPFLLWINDLSVKDPLFILPLIMGVTMFIQQKLNPTPPDPMQARIMQFMPIMFTFMFLWFPAGLVLYWVVNNTLSILQQWIITRKIEQEG